MLKYDDVVGQQLFLFAPNINVEIWGSPLFSVDSFVRRVERL
jgi:hypothetical protein